MIKNYFTISWRNLVKNKGYTAINIGGLAVGMAVAILIGLWVYDELLYDKYFFADLCSDSRSFRHGKGFRQDQGRQTEQCRPG